MRMNEEADGKISVTFSKNEALLLFEFLAERAYGKQTPGTQRILWDFEACFESTLSEPLLENYQEIIATAEKDFQ